MKVKFSLILVMVLTALAFSAGYALGIRRLSECQARSKALYNDLTAAVQRGVIAEAHARLCEDQQQGAKK